MDPTLHNNTPPDVFRRLCLLSFGALAPAEGSSFMAAAEAAGGLSCLKRQAYMQSLAEEAWLHRQCGGLAEPPAALAAVRPFGPDHPCLAELWPCPAAVAVVPLGDPSGEIWGVLHVWCFEVPAGTKLKDHRHTLDGMEDRLAAEDGVGCFVSASVPADTARPAEGHSWRLGLELALRALRLRDPEVVRRLAADWIVSGDVHGDRVTTVLLGSKLEIPTSREWLLPAASREDVPRGYRPRGGMRFASSLTAAWNAVRGRGTQDGGRQPWPEPVDVLHSFVSTAWGPVVGAVLLSRARRVVLWHTGRLAVSLGPARSLRSVILAGLTRAGRLPRLHIELRHVASADLVRAEGQLAEALRPDLEAGACVLFNVTQGNRLMSYAAHNLARRYGNLWLVYRDNDGTGLDYTAIRYEGLEATTTRLTARRSRARVNWDCVFEARRPPPVPNWQKILQKLLWVPENAGGEGFPTPV